MNNLVSYSALDPERIDRRSYSTSLTSEAYRVGLISDDDLDVLKNRSMEALAEVIGYYTKNESSSIKTDTAKNLAKSLLYNVDTYLLSLGDHEEALRVLLDRKIGELYGKGFLINKKHFEDARQLYAKVRFTRLRDADEEYNKTLDQYFKYYLTKYDPKFTSDLKIYLSLRKYDLFGNYHIDEAVEVLKKLLEINSGTKSDYELSAEEAVSSSEEG